MTIQERNDVSRKIILDRARKLYVRGDDNVQIDDDAQLSEVDFGTWVQAWVFVPIDEEGR